MFEKYPGRTSTKSFILFSNLCEALMEFSNSSGPQTLGKCSERVKSEH